MGMAARLRRERGHGLRRGRPLSLVFVDVDYERGSRPHGRGVPESPPEAWVISRSGLIHAEWDGRLLNVTRDELVDGPHPASSLIRALGGNRLVVGHGILTNDLRAAAMVTEVPDSLLRRVVDTLAFAHRLRDKKYPTGCSLEDLARENLSKARSKPRYPSSAPGLRPGGGLWGMSPYRGKADPRDDALLVAELWQTMVITRTLSWGAGEPSWTHYEGDTRPGSSPGSAALADEQIAELIGQHRQIESAEWEERIRQEGRVMRPTHRNVEALLLARLSAKDLPAPTLIRAMAERLQFAGEIPANLTLTDEDLYIACQYLGAKQNLDVRERIAANQNLTKTLREALAWALWQSTHPEWMANFWSCYHLAKDTATGYMRFQQLKTEMQ
jgi:hypothetical protein